MIEFAPFKAEHIVEVAIPEAQRRWRDTVLRPGYAKALEAPGLAWTGFVDGKIVGCAGLALQWENYARAWALLGPGAPRAWPAIIRKMKAVLAESGIRRVEADVADGFGKGCRLAHMLGFEVEGMRRCLTPDGRDFFLYARVAK